ncbi:13453_t:CDS:2, partial [Acaulospora morrowiae]
EEPVFVQQEAERDEEVVAAYFVDMDTEDINPELQNGGVEVEIFHDFPGSLHPSQKKQELPEEHDQEMRHVKILETASTTSGELPIVQERQADQDKHKSSTIEGLSTKFEKVIQQCCKVLGDDPEMLDKVDSAMNHILENTPMYVEFVLNMLNSAKNQNQNTGSSSSNEDNSQQDRIYNPPDMPGSFPNNAPLFQFRSYPSSSLTVNQLCNTPPYQPLNPQRHARLPPFPGSFPSTSNDLDSENYSSELSELQDM